jgi:hypothetical protein
MAAAAAASAQPEFKQFIKIELEEDPDPEYYTNMRELHKNLIDELDTFKEDTDEKIKGTCIDLFVNYFFKQTEVRLVPENMGLLNTIVKYFNDLLQVIIKRDIVGIQRFIDLIFSTILINVGDRRLLRSLNTTIAEYEENLNILLKECIKSEPNMDKAVKLYTNKLQVQEAQGPQFLVSNSVPIVPSAVSHFGQPVAVVVNPDNTQYVFVAVPKQPQQRSRSAAVKKHLSTVGGVVTGAAADVMGGIKDAATSVIGGIGGWFSKGKGMRSRRNKKNKKRKMRTKRREK